MFFAEGERKSSTSISMECDEFPNHIIKLLSLLLVCLDRASDMFHPVDFGILMEEVITGANMLGHCIACCAFQEAVKRQIGEAYCSHKTVGIFEINQRS
jgi:hypothetical protein